MIRPVAASAIATMTVAIGLAACVGLARFPGAPDAVTGAVMTVVAIITVGIGTAIAWRVRDSIVGLLVTVVGLMQVLVAARIAWFWVAWVAPQTLPRPSPLVLALSGTSAATCFVAVAFVIVMFPTGRVPAPRWRWLLGALVVAAVLMIVTGIWSGMPAFAPYDHQSPYTPQPDGMQRCRSASRSGCCATTSSTSTEPSPRPSRGRSSPPRWRSPSAR